MQGFQPIYSGNTLSSAAANAAEMRAKYASSPIGEAMQGLAGMMGSYQKGRERREDRDLEKEHKAAQTQLMLAQSAHLLGEKQAADSQNQGAFDALGPMGDFNVDTIGSGVGDGMSPPSSSGGE